MYSRQFPTREAWDSRGLARQDPPMVAATGEGESRLPEIPEIHPSAAPEANGSLSDSNPTDRAYSKSCLHELERAQWAHKLTVGHVDL
jgi:hypothetical protein